MENQNLHFNGDTGAQPPAPSALQLGKEKEPTSLGTSVPNAELLPGLITGQVITRSPHGTNQHLTLKVKWGKHSPRAAKG